MPTGVVLSVLREVAAFLCGGMNAGFRECPLSETWFLAWGLLGNPYTNT